MDKDELLARVEELHKALTAWAGWYSGKLSSNAQWDAYHDALDALEKDVCEFVTAENTALRVRIALLESNLAACVGGEGKRGLFSLGIQFGRTAYSEDAEKASRIIDAAIATLGKETKP